MKCKKCGETLEKEEKNCPNCGTFVPQQVYPLAVISMAVSFVSVLYNRFGILSVLSIELGIIAIRKMKGTRYLGKSLAVTGIVIGMITAIWLIAVIVMDNFIFITKQG